MSALVLACVAGCQQGDLGTPARDVRAREAHGPELTFDVGPVARLRIPDGFVKDEREPDPYAPLGEHRDPTALPLIVQCVHADEVMGEAPDGTSVPVDFTMMVTQLGSMFDEAPFFQLRELPDARTVERNGVEWTYEPVAWGVSARAIEEMSIDRGFVATAIVDDARVRLGSQGGDWTDDEILRAIDGIQWRETSARDETVDAWVDAIVANDVAAVNRFLDGGLPPNTTVHFVFPDDDNRRRARTTGLGVAAAVSNEAVVRRLLQAGADPNAVDSRGYSPAQAAAEAGNAEGLRVLVGGGGDPNRRDAQGRTPLLLALQAHDAAAVQALIAQGADVHAEVRWPGFTYLMEAARIGEVDGARHLIEGGANVDARTDEGSTAFHFAAIHGHVDMLRLLMDTGADIHAKSNDGATALTWSPRSCDVDVVQYLLGLGLDPNDGPEGDMPVLGPGWASPPNGSALSEAVGKRCPSVARVLLDAGARVDPVALAYAKAFAEKEPRVVEILAMFEEAMEQDDAP
jgi:ankyrin repeat protein